MVGLLIEVSIEDYLQQNIRVHEKTLCRPGYNHESYKKDHVGPVVLSYRQTEIGIRSLLKDHSHKAEPFARWATVDGRHHSLWKMEESSEVLEMFKQLESLYVLDGHHRLQAACDNYQAQGNPQGKDGWFLSLIYPPEEVTIHPFHRVLTIPSQDYNVLKYMQDNDIEFVPIKQLKEEHVNEFEAIYKNEEGCFGVIFNRPARSCVENLPVYKLKHSILDGLFGNNLDKYLHFLPGITSWEDILKRNNIFLMRPVRIDEIFAIADAGQIMPPKSTWFEPKPCNRMVVRLPY